MVGEKANMAVGKKELTVYYCIAYDPAESQAVCRFCQRPVIIERIVTISSIVSVTGIVAQDSRLFRAAKKKLEDVLLHQQHICDSDPCVEKLSSKVRTLAARKGVEGVGY